MNDTSHASGSGRRGIADLASGDHCGRRTVSLLPGMAVVLVFLSAGCQGESPPAAAEPTPTPEPPARVVESAATAPESASADAKTPPARGAVELLSATAMLDQFNIVNFEIEYRFTSGSPSKVYLCDIKFPGTDQWGVKPMEAFELKTEGVIKTGIEVGDNPVDRFEITLSEADSPDRGFHLISNTLSGVVQ